MESEGAGSGTQDDPFDGYDGGNWYGTTFYIYVGSTINMDDVGAPYYVSSVTEGFGLVVDGRGLSGTITKAGTITVGFSFDNSFPEFEYDGRKTTTIIAVEPEVALEFLSSPSEGAIEYIGS